MPAPIACGLCGGMAGLFGGGLNQCFPVWVGAVTGVGVGCALSLLMFMVPEERVQPVVAKVVEPVIIQNIYIVREAPFGAAKN